MQTLGLNLEGRRLDSVLLEKGKKGPQIIHFQSYELDDSSFSVKELYTDERRIATALSSKELVVRSLLLPLKSRRKILAALPFQIENSVPFSPEETLSYALIHKAKKTFPVTLFATTLSAFDAHIEKWRSLEVDPDAVSSLPHALHRFACFFFPNISSLFLFFGGQIEGTWLVIDEGRLLFSQSLEIGPNLEHDLLRIKHFAKARVAHFDALPMLFCGEIPPSLALFFKEQFGTPLDPPSEEYVKTLPFAASFGIALDALLQDKKSVEFRQGKRASKKSAQLFRKGAVLYVAASLAFAVLFGTLHQVVVRSKKSALEKRLSTFLNQELSLDAGLALLEKETAGGNGPASGLLFVPKVANVLQWLGSHPQMKPPLEISRVLYQLERYPKLNGGNEPFLACLELEFFSSSPTAARDFHNALLTGDALVDAKKEIVWRAHHNSYFAKFYLKTRAL